MPDDNPTNPRNEDIEQLSESDMVSEHTGASAQENSVAETLDEFETRRVRIEDQDLDKAIDERLDEIAGTPEPTAEDHLSDVAAAGVALPETPVGEAEKSPGRLKRYSSAMKKPFIATGAGAKHAYSKYRITMDNADEKMRAGTRNAFSNTGNVLKERTRSSREWLYVHKPDWVHKPDFSNDGLKRKGKIVLVGAAIGAGFIAAGYGIAELQKRSVVYEQRRAEVSRQVQRPASGLERATPEDKSVVPTGTMSGYRRAPASTALDTAITDTTLTDTVLTSTAPNPYSPSPTDTAFGTALDTALTQTTPAETITPLPRAEPSSASPDLLTPPLEKIIDGGTASGAAAGASAGADSASYTPSGASASNSSASGTPASAASTSPSKDVPSTTSPARAEPPVEYNGASKPVYKSRFNTSGDYLLNPAAVVISDGIAQRITLSTRQKGLPRGDPVFTLDNTLEGTNVKVRGVMATELEGLWSKHAITTVYLKSAGDSFTLDLPQDKRAVSASLSPTFNTAEDIALASAIDGQLTISYGELKQDKILVYDIAARDSDGTIVQSVKVPIRFIVTALATSPAPVYNSSSQESVPERKAPAASEPVPEYKAPPVPDRTPAAQPLEYKQSPIPDARVPEILEPPAQPPVSYNVPGDDPSWDIPSTTLDEIVYEQPKPVVDVHAYASADNSVAAASVKVAPTESSTSPPIFDYSPKTTAEAPVTSEYNGPQGTTGRDNQGIEYTLSPEEKRLIGEVKVMFDGIQNKRFSSDAERMQYVERGLVLVQDLHKYCDEKKTCGTPDGYDRDQIMRIGRAKTAIHNDDKPLFERIMYEYAFQAQAMEESVIGKLLENDVQFNY
jgi:hypothetical protein